MSECSLVLSKGLFLVATLLLNQCTGESGHSSGAKLLRRFEYKYSFKGPHLVQPDGTIPFWDHYGDAIPSDESVRITPSLKSKTGSVWSRILNTNEHWEVEVVFRINGRGRVGADGLALWYTEERGPDGPIFGGKDQWKGLGVFFDSYDNDQLNNNPYIMMILNDGTQQYNHDRDGADQILGGCIRDFRNKPYPTRAKIEYYNKVLTIFYHNGVKSNRDDFEICARVENVDLPKHGYFGVSAATGGLADDHDVLAFLTHSLIASKEETTAESEDVSAEEERKKIEQEYQEYDEKLSRAKEDYQKEHPKKPGEYIDEENVFEAPEMRNMKIILDGQSEIYSLVKALSIKLDDIMGHLERQLTLSAKMPGLNQQNAIESHEVAGLLSGQKEVVDHIRDIRSVIDDVKSKVSSLGQGTIRQDGDVSILKSLQDLGGYVAAVHSDVKSLAASSTQMTTNLPCAELQCVTTSYLFAFFAVQLLCIIGFMFYRAKHEAASKKFY